MTATANQLHIDRFRALVARRLGLHFDDGTTGVLADVLLRRYRRRERVALSQTPLERPAWDIGLALDLLRRERFLEALVLVEAFPPESSQDPEVVLLHAVLLTHSGRFADAERACQRLLEIDELTTCGSR